MGTKTNTFPVGKPGTPALSVGLGWTALTAIVNNATNQWLHVTSANADVPPYSSGFILPVNGFQGEAVWRCSNPKIVQPPIIPTETASITWSSDAYGAAPGVSTYQSPNLQQLLATIVGAVNTTAVSTFPVPSGTEALMLVMSGSVTGAIKVTGTTTGADYLNVSALVAQRVLTCVVGQAADPSVTVSFGVGAAPAACAVVACFSSQVVRAQLSGSDTPIPVSSSGVLSVSLDNVTVAPIWVSGFSGAPVSASLDAITAFDPPSGFATGLLSQSAAGTTVTNILPAVAGHSYRLKRFSGAWNYPNATVGIEDTAGNVLWLGQSPVSAVIAYPEFNFDNFTVPVGRGVQVRITTASATGWAGYYTLSWVYV